MAIDLTKFGWAPDNAITYERFTKWRAVPALTLGDRAPAEVKVSMSYTDPKLNGAVSCTVANHVVAHCKAPDALDAMQSLRRALTNRAPVWKLIRLGYPAPNFVTLGAKPKFEVNYGELVDALDDAATDLFLASAPD